MKNSYSSAYAIMCKQLLIIKTIILIELQVLFINSARSFEVDNFVPTKNS